MKVTRKQSTPFLLLLLLLLLLFYFKLTYLLIALTIQTTSDVSIYILQKIHISLFINI